MSSGLEAKIDDVIVQLLTPVATTACLQLVKRIGDDTLEPNRLAVATQDHGEDRSVKYAGLWGRKMRTTITFKANSGDKTAEWMEAVGSQVFSAIQTPTVNISWRTIFRMLVIHEVAESELSFDKRNWVKTYVLTLTAIPF